MPNKFPAEFPGGTMSDHVRKAAQALIEAIGRNDDYLPVKEYAGELDELSAALAAHQAPSAVAEGWKLLKDTTQAERSWPEDAAHENGSYSNACMHCLRMFVGHKRRVVCKVCDATPPAPAAKVITAEDFRACRDAPTAAPESADARDAARYRCLREYTVDSYIACGSGEQLDAEVDRYR